MYTSRRPRTAWFARVIVMLAAVTSLTGVMTPADASVINSCTISRCADARSADSIHVSRATGPVGRTTTPTSTGSRSPMTSAARPLPEWLTVSTGPAPVVVDGRACWTRAAFFEEVARVLRFPGYFGRNWDAFADCLRDTTGAGDIALVVTHAEDLLADEPPEQLATLLAVLNQFATGLTLTLCTEARLEARLRERVAAALT